MERILLENGIPKETVAAITILYRNTKVKVRSPDGDADYFDIVAGVLQGDTLAPYLFIICLDYVLRTSINKIKENSFDLIKKRRRSYPQNNYRRRLRRWHSYSGKYTRPSRNPTAYSGTGCCRIGLHVNSHKTEYMCLNQTGDISTLSGSSLKLLDKEVVSHQGSSVLSTEKDSETMLTKAWTAIDKPLVIWMSELTDKLKRSFFKVAVVSILLYGSTTWTLTKCMEKKLDSNYIRMLRAILNKSRRQHPTKHQLYGHRLPITKTIKIRRTAHAGHYWRIRDELISDVLLLTPSHWRAKVGRTARTYIQ